MARRRTGLVGLIRHGASSALRTASAAVLIMSLPSCGGGRSVGPAEAKRRILAALPPSWRLKKPVSRSAPFAPAATIQGSGQRGEELILTGPRTMRVEGYYCGDSYCALDATETLEIWIMPPAYDDGQDVPDLQAWRTPDRIAQTRAVQVYALVSRDIGKPGVFDASFNGSSRETPTMAPAPARQSAKSSDLVLSWVDWRHEILAALDRNR